MATVLHISYLVEQVSLKTYLLFSITTRHQSVQYYRNVLYMTNSASWYKCHMFSRELSETATLQSESAKSMTLQVSGLYSYCLCNNQQTVQLI